MSEEKTLQQLLEARKSGDEDALRNALLVHANALLTSSKFAEAGAIFDEAITLHETSNRLVEQSRCLHLSATAYRFAGRLDIAEDRIRKAVELAHQNTPIAVSSWTEYGETAMAQGKYLNATVYYDKALEHGKNAGLLPAAQVTLMRRLAQAQDLGHSSELSALTLRSAVGVAKTTNDIQIVIRLQIEEATAWLNSSTPEQAVTALEESEQLALQTEDNVALADLELLRSTLAVRAKDLDKAFGHAQKARQFSLQAVDPISYTSSAIAMSQIAELQDNKMLAYEVLAVGWVTLSDVLGNEVAQSTFAPKIRQLVEKWGKEEFLRIKKQYEELRRNAQT